MPLIPEEISQYISDFTDVSSLQIIAYEEFKKTEVTSNSNYIVVKLGKMNDERYINKTLEEVNLNIQKDDIFIGAFETFTSRRLRKKAYQIPVINKFFLLYEFLFLRIIPKLKILKKIYFILSKGQGRLLSKAEMLGRLVSCGFEIIDSRKINGLNYFIVKKIKQPLFDLKPSYGPVFGMNRIGKNGKIIRVFKFRTMHPYSEYLHDYVLKHNGYAQTGKPADDFRLTPWGKIMRKYWLDELPQLYNILKGEMKLVGVRPISLRYFQDIPPNLKALRLQHKPGCIPPYVALNRNADVESVQQAEIDYLIQKNKHPFTTDTLYFFRALYNILIRRKRSA
jgi:lipopolysaccharide/colanic/teichoic acid biosynthesis glycosyltransferase